MNKKFNIDFVGHKKIYFTISIVLIIVSIVSTFVFGAKLDIQFKGGTIITYLYEGDINVDAFRSAAVDSLGGIGVTATTGSDFNTGKNNIQLSLLSNSGLTADKQIELTATLTEKFSENNLTLSQSTDVSPSSGKEFFSKCLVAVAFSSLVLIIYIALRFKNIGGWLAGVCAIVALFHDIFIVYGTFVVFHMSIDANFMAVVLTILGYSVNDTIVIYDRIRENKHVLPKNLTLAELTNRSINESLTRSINTSVTTLFAMLTVSVVAMIYGVTSIISFSFPMMIGLISGTYSSICIAAPLWVYLEENKKDKGAKNAKPASENA